MSDVNEQALPPGDVAPVTETKPQEVESPNAGATPAGNASEGETQSSAQPASSGAGTSPTAENSPAEPKSFEQRVEQRFLQVEAFILKMPHSIAHAFHQGSAEPEELAKRAIDHLFGHNE